ncbi:hypothetical protein [Mycobacterium sp. EPa45]|uniref:hypothetical protein n=1 Tax=Mycobacterium sp. EPa45 TaxID=1545728 RepID=UPI0006421483|nr:hypothetical protein [Mycobacterium sp. EPa45]AKK25488.1 hypothetical protein AB431_00790 [Mycobacterium sp. EPa45]
MHVKAGIFSLTAPGGTDDDEYLKWHLLDHMPEQYQLPGIVLGQRWIADGRYLDARIVSQGSLGNVGNVVSYLVTDPVARTLDDFMDLGARLSEAGRYPHPRPALQVAALRLLDWHASPTAVISPEVVPFRPHRGVVVILEQPVTDSHEWLGWIHTQHLPELMGVAGVAGAWMFGSTAAWAPAAPMWSRSRQYITVVYLDSDPLAASSALRAMIEQRWESGVVVPVFAGPLRSMTHWEAWP